jgi:uncharacterized membrane protein
MGTSLSNIITKWMKALKVPVSVSFLHNLLEQHPHYPAAISITDTLDEMGIQNLVLEMEWESLAEVPLPFLAHVHTNGGEFEIISDKSLLKDPESEFRKRWSGIVIAAEPPVNFAHRENEKWLTKDRMKTYLIVSIVLIFLLLTSLVVHNSGSYWLGMIMISSLAGIGVSILIVMQEIGIDNDLSIYFCKNGNESNCASIINSKGAKLPFQLKWSDIGLVYFCAQWVILFIGGVSGTSGQSLLLFKWLSIGSIFFLCFSVYYQWKVAQKWCRLCLLSVAVLMVQIVLFEGFINNIANDLTFRILVINIIIVAGILFGWKLFKPFITHNYQLRNEWFRAMRFKNNSSVFEWLLRKERKVDVHPFSKELEIANAHAKFQILAVCNPYCKPCSQAHLVLHEIVEKYGKEVSVIIRFGIDAHKSDHIGTKTVDYMLKVIESAGSTSQKFTGQVLNDWFSMMDIENFKTKYPLHSHVNTQSNLEEHANWYADAHISATPTFFVNGYQLPEAYNAHDLLRMLRSMLNQEVVFAEKIAPAVSGLI